MIFVPPHFFQGRRLRPCFNGVDVLASFEPKPSVRARGCVNICPHIRLLFVDQSSQRRLENFGEDIPTSPEVIEAHTLNFKPNFKFSRWKLFGGPPSPLGDGIGSLGQSVTSVKIWDSSTASWPKCYLQKNVHLGWSLWATRTFLFVDQSSPFFSTNVEGLVVD